jgi:hypothetical protein
MSYCRIVELESKNEHPSTAAGCWDDDTSADLEFIKIQVGGNVRDMDPNNQDEGVTLAGVGMWKMQWICGTNSSTRQNIVNMNMASQSSNTNLPVTSPVAKKVVFVKICLQSTGTHVCTVVKGNGVVVLESDKDDTNSTRKVIAMYPQTKNSRYILDWWKIIS